MWEMSWDNVQMYAASIPKAENNDEETEQEEEIEELTGAQLFGKLKR